MKLEDIYKKSQYTRISRQIYKNPEQSIDNINGLQYMVVKGTIEFQTKTDAVYGEQYYGKSYYTPIYRSIVEDTPPTSSTSPTRNTGSNPPLYNSSDFGENSINNHDPLSAWHSEKNQTIFNYVTRGFRDRCTSYESYKTSPYNGFVNDELAACKFLKADIVYTPYVNAAKWTNTDNENFILTVGSHYDNDGQGIHIIGDDNNRHDITADANIFLSDSIAVSARRDTPELFKNSTSEGFGMEFFEDCSKEALDPVYPDKDVDICFAEIRTSEDGFIVYGNRTMDGFFGDSLTVGEDTYIVYRDGHSEHRVVAEILDRDSYRVEEAFTPYPITDFVSASKLIDGVLTKIADVCIESNNLVRRYNKVENSFLDILSIGDVITLTYPDTHTEIVVIDSIPRYDFFKSTTQPTLFSNNGIYVWRYDTIGTYIGGQAESWAVPLVAGKLKVIKMSTNSDWETVRLAARVTAKRNPTGIHEIDNSDWDIYRGFGCIQVQDAINYINNL
jgi:hypothetical protein